MGRVRRKAEGRRLKGRVRRRAEGKRQQAEG